MFECSKLNQTFLPKSFFIINKKKKAQKVIGFMDCKPDPDPRSVVDTTDGAANDPDVAHADKALIA